MSDMNLTPFVNDGIEILVNEQTGESYASISGYARMSGKDKSTISRRCSSLSEDTVASGELKIAEIATASGLKTVALIPANLVYKWLLRDNIELAEKMGVVGATVYLQMLAGYTPMKQPAQQPALPPADIRVDKLRSNLEAFGYDLDNPRFKQGLQDIVGDILGLSGKPSLTGGDSWLGVAERAEQLGYPVATVARCRSQLGKAVKSYGLPSQREKRLCNGSQREINLYLVSHELDQAIHAYMKHVSN